MAPIKFEENIRGLEQRRLEPSQDAWEELSTRLDNNSNKRSKGVFLYLGIAASIVGVLLVYTLLIKSENAAEGIQEVVNTEAETKIETNSPQIIDTNNIESKVVESTPPETLPKTEGTIKATDNAPIVPKPNTENVVATANEQMPKAETSTQKIKLYESSNTFPKTSDVASVETEAQKRLIEHPLNTLDYESAKVIEVVAQIKELEAQGNEVTESEIDALLKQAERDILKQRLYNETTRTVDADALLQDVEEDLEQSFRARVFQNLKSNFNSVKTAVAARNN